jgi:mono/diheme cytochrome c family protein
MLPARRSTTPRATPSLQRMALPLGAVLLFGAATAWLASTAHAQGAEIFKDADIALGEKLIAEHKCVECHTRQVGGDGSSIYKPLGRINTAGLLRGMVEMCNTQMNLGLFPEEVTAVAAVINRDHYKFK